MRRHKKQYYTEHTAYSAHQKIGTIADLALYPIFLLIRTPSQMSECWHYIQFGTISDCIITGIHCTCNLKVPTDFEVNHRSPWCVTKWRNIDANPGQKWREKSAVWGPTTATPTDISRSSVSSQRHLWSASGNGEMFFEGEQIKMADCALVKYRE